MTAEVNRGQTVTDVILTADLTEMKKDYLWMSNFKKKIIREIKV